MRTRILALLVLPMLLQGTACADRLLTPSEEVVFSTADGAEKEAISYSLLMLDTRWTQATGINDAATVVGRKYNAADSVWEAALWDGSFAMTLDIPRSSFAGINTHGVAIGWQADQTSWNIHRRGFIHRSGQVIPVAGEHLEVSDGFDEFVFEGSLDDDRVQPWDINHDGVVIARALHPYEKDGETWWRRYAFAWQEGTGITSYIAGGQPTAINNHGQVVGWGWYTMDPVLWEAGSYEAPQVVRGLRDHFPGHEIELKSINDKGQIMGLACKQDYDRRLCAGGAYDRRGFVLDGGTVVELSLPRNTFELSSLDGFNGSGQVVGTIRKREKGDNNNVPVLWTVTVSGTVVQELPRDGYTHAHAIAINDHGQVAGHANPWEAALWNPTGDTPPPSGEGPTASFTYSCGNSPTCTFTDTSTGISLSSWRWDFGDGSAGSEARNPSHQFTAQGKYTVALTVTDGNSLSDTAQASVDCKQHPRHGLRCS
jgi:hypothetical protein